MNDNDSDMIIHNDFDMTIDNTFDKDNNDLTNLKIDKEYDKASNDLTNKILGKESDNTNNNQPRTNNNNTNLTKITIDDKDNINLMSNKIDNNDEIDNASDESDQELDEIKIINIVVCNNKPIESILTIEERCYLFTIDHVLFSRDQLTMRKDNIAHFISKDYKICSEVCRQLVTEGYINLELMKNENLEIGYVVQTGISNGKLIYSIIVKERHDELLKIENVINGLESL